MIRIRTLPFQAAVLFLLGGCGPVNTSPAPAESTCVDFQSIPSDGQPFSGSTFEFPPLHFHNPTSNGSPLPITHEDRVEDQDGKPELNVPISRSTGSFQPLIVEFPRRDFPGGVNAAYVTLRHSYAASVIAKNRSGVIVATAIHPTQHIRGLLTLQGPAITRLEFNASETMVYSICWI